MQPLCRIAHQRFDTTTNVPLGRRTCKRCALHAAIAGQMEQARAARAILKDARPPDPYDGKTRRQEQAELDAFMAIFHPGHNRIMLDDEVTE